MASSAPRTIVIRPGHSTRQYWLDLWDSRELVYILAQRDVRVRYKQTVIGVGWSVVRPLLAMAALTWIFSRGAGVHSPDPSIPYPLWVFIGTIAWQFFSDAVTAASNSLVGNAAMLSKIYFPRLVLPLSRMLVGFLDFAVAFASFLGLAAWYRFNGRAFEFGWPTLLVPAWLLLAFVATLGLGCWFAALNVKYRDFTYVVPFIVTLGIYVSPVAIGTAEITHSSSTARILYSLNPMVGVIDGFRWCLFGEATRLSWPGQTASAAVAVLLAGGGLWFFKKSERSFADIV